MQFDCGYLSPYFVTDPERMEVAFENVYVLIHEKKISSKKDLLSLLEQITGSGKPLLIIAEDVEGEALATLVVSKLRGPLQVAAVRAPGFGDQRKSMLQDIALLTGGKAITEGPRHPADKRTDFRPRSGQEDHHRQEQHGGRRQGPSTTSIPLSLSPAPTQMLTLRLCNLHGKMPAFIRSPAGLAENRGAKAHSVVEEKAEAKSEAKENKR